MCPLLSFYCTACIGTACLFPSILYLMPKLIDNYVLSRKIGAGQYG